MIDHNNHRFLSSITPVSLLPSSSRIMNDSTASDFAAAAVDADAATAYATPTNANAKPTKATRINWSKSPHRERLAQVVQDWFSHSGLALDATTGKPITDSKVYAEKVGISHMTLYKYILKDPKKRRSINEGIGRGKKRLIDDEGIDLIVNELKAKAEASNGFSRKEAVSMIAEQFDISRIAASRQLTRLILPKLTMDGSTLFGTDGDGDDDEGYDWMGEESILPNSLEQQHQYLPNNQPIRSIVISGVTSGRGRELFEYFCKHGHHVAGCGVLPSAIQSMKMKFPNSKLAVVDTTDVESVGQWASELDASGMDIDMIIANAEVSPGPEHTRRCPAWEMTGADLDRTMDANVKGIHTMIRHFVPRLIQKNNATSGGVRKERVFVAMSPSMGVRLEPLLAAHCASSFAVEGLIKCVAMSIPEPLSAITFSSSKVDGSVQHDKGASVGNENSHSIGGGSQWVNIAAPMLLHTKRDSNGKSMSI